MPTSALVLVLLAALTHASWNLIAKQASHSTHFVWLYSTITALCWGPLAIWALLSDSPLNQLSTWLAFLGSAVLHTLYSESLQRGYRVGDLSLVYPLARGTGPLFSFFGAIWFLDEHPSALASVGAALVVSGVFALSFGQRKNRENRTIWPSIAWGLLTGAFISLYTIWDARSVKILMLSPILVDYFGNLLRWLILSPRVISDRATPWGELKQYWRHALGVSLLAPTGYILILYASRFANISQIAPARELSIVVGALLGGRLLGEPLGAARLIPALVITLGVLLLALG